MFTLFKSTSGGISWDDVVVPLSNLGWQYVAIFTGFIGFFLFAILNIVTAVFCQKALESAQCDKELMTLNQLKDVEQRRAKLLELFVDYDLDESGYVTMDELESVLQEPQNQAYLQALGIDTNDAWTMVKLLDSDNSGTVEKQEFVDGCMSLRGEAKAIHLAMLSYDQKITFQLLEDFASSVESRLCMLLDFASGRP